MIPFGKWQPDLAPTVDCLEVCNNLLPYNNRLMPFPALSTYSSSYVSGTPLLMFNASTMTGAPYTFVCSNTKLYKLVANALSDISKTGGYTTGTNSTWSMTVYGNALIATNDINPIQKLADLTTGNFVDLGGTPPLARFVCMFKDHLFLGATTETSTLYPRRLFRSKQGDIENWVVDSATGCGFYDLPSWGENITGLTVNGDYLFVYMTNSVWMVSFIGSPLWFSYNKIYDGTSALSQGCIANIGNQTNIVLTADDVLMVRGTSISSVGRGIRSVLSTINKVHANRITHLVDHEKKLVIWSYVSTNSSGTPDKLLVYNWEEDRFTSANQSLHCLGKVSTSGLTFDTMNSLYTSFNTINTSFDSPIWSLNTPMNGGVNWLNQLAIMSGAPLYGSVRISEVSLDNVGMLTKVVPHIEGRKDDVALYITIHSKLNPLDDFVDYQAMMSLKGECLTRRTGQYFKATFAIYGEHNGFFGYTPTYVLRGKR